MKNKFDADDLFDDAARDAFKNFEMPFEAENWKRLEAELEKRQRKLPPFWLFKSLEALFVSGIFALLVYTATPNQPLTTSPALQAAQQQHNGNTLKNIAAEELANQPLAQANNQIANGQNVHANTNVGRENLSNSNQQSAAGTNNSAANSKANANTNSRRRNQSANSNNGNSGSHKNGQNNLQNAANSNAINNLAANNNADNLHSINALANANANAENLELPRILVNPLDIAEVAKIKQADPEPEFGLQKAKIIQPYVRQIRLGLLAGAEAHSRTDYGRGAGGYTVGIIGEGEFNSRLALQSGVLFSYRQYEQERSYVVDNQAQEGLVHQVAEQRQTHLTLVQIPVLLQITAFRNDQWRIYAQTGFSAYLNLSQTYSGSRQTTLLQDAGAVRFQTNIDRRDYEGALFQTGKMQNNFFLNVQAGIGIERQLTDQWSLFVQPNFQYSLTKINSLGNRNHVIALNVGAKSTF